MIHSAMHKRAVNRCIAVMPRMRNIVLPHGLVLCPVHRAVGAAQGRFFLVVHVARPRRVMLVGITQPLGRIIVRNAHRLTMRVGMVKHGRTLPISRVVTPPPVHRPVRHGVWPHAMFRRPPRFLTQRAHMNFRLIVITGHRR